MYALSFGFVEEYAWEIHGELAMSTVCATEFQGECGPLHFLVEIRLRRNEKPARNRTVVEIMMMRSVKRDNGSE